MFEQVAGFADAGAAWVFVAVAFVRVLGVAARAAARAWMLAIAVKGTKSSDRAQVLRAYAAVERGEGGGQRGAAKAARVLGR
ncbi:hypothetical protein [Saccharothrix sp. HUAS TT1]|uniref:hypothetical protein n=1 Tax=unclassified Saccharothrix TaxID=2593673 RepID=UPI00345B5245